MKRRNGIIALLAGFAGSMIGQKKPQFETTTLPNNGIYTGTIPALRQDIRLSLTLVDGNEYGVSGIDVSYGSRVVHLAAAEIMEALEVK